MHQNKNTPQKEPPSLKQYLQFLLTHLTPKQAALLYHLTTFILIGASLYFIYQLGDAFGKFITTIVH